MCRISSFLAYENEKLSPFFKNYSNIKTSRLYNKINKIIYRNSYRPRSRIEPKKQNYMKKGKPTQNRFLGSVVLFYMIIKMGQL